jgi:hypothetical protein
MKVKVVQLSEPHVMRVLSFPTPKRTAKTTANDVKARGLRENSVSNYLTQFCRVSRSHDVATPPHML